MPPFEEILKVIVMLAAVLGLPSLTYLGVRAGLATIRGMEREAAPPDGPVAEEVAQLRTELAELQERVDFAERMLAQRPDPARLEGT
jgi:hypothetical protein